MEKRENKNKIKKNRKLCNIMTILFTITTIFLIYNILLLGPIEPLLRYMIIAILILMIIRCLISRTLVIRNEKKKVFFFSSKTFLFSILFLVISVHISVAYASVNSFNKTKNTSSKSIDKPFTVLLMGIDSTADKLSPEEKGNSDTLLVLSFNPDTLVTTMLSIPRDSYVDISCMNKKNKITHAGWYGEECVEETIENFLGIDIDYYAKVNFKALIKIVDALGGIEVEVPKDLCTDNSNRKGKVCIKKGKQKLNGEEALVLSRNRKQLANGDIDRGLNQQIVIKGILNAAGEKITNISTMYSLLDTIADNIDTNFSTDQILSFYNIGKNIIKKSNKSVTDSLTIRQLYLSGEGKYIYDTATKLNLYNYILYDESIEAVSDAINANMNKKEIEMIKTFKWSIDEDYHTIPIGKINTGTSTNAGSTNETPITNKDNSEEKEESNTPSQIITLPNFIGKNKSEVDTWCKENNIYVSYSYQDVDSTYIQDQVIEQNVSSGTDIKTISSLKITLANVKENTDNNQIVEAN